MVNATGCPSLVIAATGSGVGKTSLALGIVRVLARRGLRVQTFKVGPDFLDPSWLALASGRTCYNLDGWMTSPDYVRQLFARATVDADMAIIEGVMGLFDGASPNTLEGSTAEVAIWLDAPVLLAVNAHGTARSLAATAYGFAHFEPRLRLMGIIANHSGSPRHREWLAESLRSAGLPPLIGAMPRDALPKLESRHLGLITASPGPRAAATLEQLADACEKHLDVEAICRCATACVPESFHGLLLPKGSTALLARLPSADNSNVPGQGDVAPTSGRRASSGTPQVRIGVARDDAFHFYYPDNLEQLEDCSAELVPFSPLADRSLPADLDAIYLGGGYPEVHAERLAANTAMLKDVRDFAASGRLLYAECGGLVYLGRSVETLDGRRHSLAGVLPVDTKMLPRLSALGYAEATAANDSIWGPAGWMCRGHEFHYSRISADDSRSEGWRAAYSLCRRRAEAGEPEGFARGKVLASYIHLHWASRPDAARRFLDCAKEHA